MGREQERCLLQGFGWAVNSRYIHIAKNNIELADLSFKAQVIATVKNVADLYWDLVSFDKDLAVKQQALEIAQKLYEDNKKRVTLGVIAPIDIVQAEAQVETGAANECIQPLTTLMDWGQTAGRKAVSGTWLGRLARIAQFLKTGYLRLFKKPEENPRWKRARFRSS